MADGRSLLRSRLAAAAADGVGAAGVLPPGPEARRLRALLDRIVGTVAPRLLILEAEAMPPLCLVAADGRLLRAGEPTGAGALPPATTESLPALADQLSRLAATPGPLRITPRPLPVTGHDAGAVPGLGPAALAAALTLLPEDTAAADPLTALAELACGEAVPGPEALTEDGLLLAGDTLLDGEVRLLARAGEDGWRGTVPAAGIEDVVTAWVSRPR